MSEPPQFRLTNVSFGYSGSPNPTIKSLSLSINQGERIAFLGESGCGKTTLLKLLQGGLSATEGEVRSLGQDPKSISPRNFRALQANIGFIWQDHGLVSNLRVGQSVIAGRMGKQSYLRSLRSFFFPTEEERGEISYLLQQLKLKCNFDDFVDSLSLGQQQRIAIARSLYQRPVAIMADEPIASLDPRTSVDILNLFMDLSIRNRFTFCIALHQVEWVCIPGLFTRVIGIRDGKIVFDRSPDNFFATDQELLYG